MRSRCFAVACAAAIVAFALSPDVSAQNAPGANGKPNFSGHWGPAPAAQPGVQAARPRSQFQGGDVPKLPTRRETGLQNIPLAEWGREAFLYWTAGDGAFYGETGSADDPRYHQGTCRGPKSPAQLGNNFYFIQNPGLLTLISASDQPWIRKIWIGKTHPEDLTEYVPFWMGHSVGRWDGNTLVVDTVRIKEGTLIDSPLIPTGTNTGAIIPHSGNLRMTERMSLDATGNLKIERTFADPVAFTKPWSDSRTFRKRVEGSDQDMQTWEVGESQTVCDPTGGYWKEDDPWFDNFDKLKKEILPDAQRLDKGPPPVPEQFRQQ